MSNRCAVAIEATNSSFDRLRVRTATGNMFFRGCSSQQIQATSNYGSIVYDNGDFQAGLARFESDHGNVALGVRGGAQIGAHSGSGHVVSNFQDGAFVQGNPETKQATVGGGGPVVTATSEERLGLPLQRIDGSAATGAPRAQRQHASAH